MDFLGISAIKINCYYYYLLLLFIIIKSLHVVAFKSRIVFCLFKSMKRASLFCAKRNMSCKRYLTSVVDYTCTCRSDLVFLLLTRLCSPFRLQTSC